MFSFRALLVSALLSVFAAVATADCASQPHCLSVTTKAQSGDIISLSFNYDHVSGDICGLTGPSGSYVQVKGQKGTIAITGLQMTPVPNVVVQDLGGGDFEAVNLVIAFTTASGSGSIGVDKSGNAGTAIEPAGSGNAANQVYIDATNGGFPLQQVTEVKTQSSCGAITGDPVFSGFLGQKYLLKGEGGKVFNILSDADMQINTRLVQLTANESKSPAEIRAIRLKSLFSLPRTTPFSHDGPYMGELGAVIPGGHTLYAKAGPYASGWETVQVDDVDYPASADAMVFGKADNTFTVSRPDSHNIVIETPFLYLVVTNSDNFFNIHKAHLKLGFDFQTHPLAGALGQSASPEWETDTRSVSWRAQLEEDTLVESNDLFARSPVMASAM